MNPSTTQTSMQVYAASQEQYKTPPNAVQMDVGVVPLDTLPASWWNWLWEQITKNNNAVYQGIADIRTELLNVLSDANITPSSLDATQLLQAINVIRKRVPTTDPVSHEPIPGAVISSAARSSVSVDPTTGAMTVNALSDWMSQNSVKDVINAWETEQEQDLQDGLTSIENTITARAHVLCIEVEETTGQYTNASYSLNALSRIDGRPLSSYTPAAGDVLLLHFPAASLYQTRTHTGGTLTVGQYSFTWTLTADFDEYVLIVLTGTTTGNVCFGIHKSTEDDILDAAHPVGSLYWTNRAPNNGGDPNVLFVGTWVRIKDKFVYAMGDNDTVNATGGVRTNTLTANNIPSHTHTLDHTHKYTPSGYVASYSNGNDNKVAGAGGHNHRIGSYSEDGNTPIWNLMYMGRSGSEAYKPHSVTAQWVGDHTHPAYFTGKEGTTTSLSNSTTSSYGKETPNALNNMPPYICKYCWERTA